jgi:hypothetical protein
MNYYAHTAEGPDGRRLPDKSGRCARLSTERHNMKRIIDASAGPALETNGNPFSKLTKP